MATEDRGCMQRFTSLKVWKRSHELALRVYRLTDSFPKHELFGLTSQLRRATTSIACNIAEGCKRQHPPDFARFLNIAEASASEAECLVLLSRDLGYLSAETAKPLLTELEDVVRMLFVLRRRVEVGADA